MKLYIPYEGAWRNSFLSGSNDEPIPDEGRKFLGTGDYNYIRKDVCENTVLGILSFLIGDRRKLYQAKQSKDFFFKDMKITWEDQCETWEEIVTLRNNNKNSLHKSSLTGSFDGETTHFNSDIGQELWSVLNLSFDELLEFILDEKFEIKDKNKFDLQSIKEYFEKEEVKKKIHKDLIKDIKKVNLAIKSIEKAINKGNKKGFINAIKFNPFSGDQIKVTSFYCSALYLQYLRLQVKYGDISFLLTKQKKIPGFSVNGTTLKDLEKNIFNRKNVRVWRTPYIKKDKGKKVYLTKADGTLIIDLDIDKEKAEELKSMIENANLATFKVGKKGIAYVDKIII